MMVIAPSTSTSIPSMLIFLRLVICLPVLHLIPPQTVCLKRPFRHSV
jgi:hypothetical protein